jgi:hypothetical protein
VWTIFANGPFVVALRLTADAAIVQAAEGHASAGAVS